jgi:predicted membrane channel-forming protein YqfA (hemolysin III family)
MLRKKPQNRAERKLVRKIHIFGWLVFILSAFAYIASSWRSGDALGLAGSLLFLLACLVFLVPYFLGKE